MAFVLDYLAHRRDCRFKQQEREDRIRRLPAPYHEPITDRDRAIVSRPIARLVTGVHQGIISPLGILRTYGKIAVKAHARTNCLTEVMIESAEEWLREEEDDGDSKTNSDSHEATGPCIDIVGPLGGVPVSLKDTVIVGGYDATVGYSSFVGNKDTSCTRDGPMVQLLKDAGAVPYVKTNVPITLLSFESTNDVWGRCVNPHNPRYGPGGSTGGEAALLALGGSRIGVGSDVAGSVRVPAHFSGCYSLRCSAGRWPKAGVHSSMPGQEGVPSVYSPMARTLDDLAYFTRAVVRMRPWRYDPTVHLIPWRDEVARDLLLPGPAPRLRIGVLRSDGVVDPSPACRRALDMAELAMRRAGHEIVSLEPAKRGAPPSSPSSSSSPPSPSSPSPPSSPSSSSPPSPSSPSPPPDMYEALQIASLLLNADGGATFSAPMRAGEWQDAGVAQMARLMRCWAPARWLYWLWVRFVRRDATWAGLVRGWRPQTVAELWDLARRRDEYRARWHAWWERARLDALLAPPNATPAVPHGGMRSAVSSCGYTFVWSLLDYTAGVLPVTHVDKAKDGLPQDFDMRRLNGVAQGAYRLYDAESMHGLPVGVQVVGRRLEEEKVLAIMARLEEALGEDRYQHLDLSVLEGDGI